MCEFPHRDVGLSMRFVVLPSQIFRSVAMSEAAEAFDKLNDRRRQPDASEVFMYTFAAVGALTLAEMDAAHANVRGAASPPATHGNSLIPPAPGASGALGPHTATDSAFRAAISALTAPLGDGAETPTRSSPAGSDSGALAATESETSPAVAPLFSAPDGFGAIPSIATESFEGNGGTLLSGSALENPFASLAGGIGDRGDLSPLPVYAAAPGGSGDVLQALGAYQTFSPEAVGVSVITIAAFGEAATSSSLAAAARG
jgi:hypothetical protein